jgi:Tfp pilus assembly protein PilF
LRSDPENRPSRIQLAYTRVRESATNAAESLDALERALAALPGDVLAHLYAAEIRHALEDTDGAALHFRRACELWEAEPG